jgi:hypothetical protein
MPDPEEDAVTRPELLVLTGMHAPGVEGVISRIRALRPGHRRAAPRPAGHRVRAGAPQTAPRPARRDDGAGARTRLPVLHPAGGPAPAAARAGRPRRAALVVLHLDPALEPEQVCWALVHVLVDGSPITDHLDLRGVVTAVDAGCSPTPRWRRARTPGGSCPTRSAGGTPTPARPPLTCSAALPTPRTRSTDGRPQAGPCGPLIAGSSPRSKGPVGPLLRGGGSAGLRTT